MEVDKIEDLNVAKKSLPFHIKDFNEGKEPLRMQVSQKKVSDLKFYAWRTCTMYQLVLQRPKVLHSIFFQIQIIY